MMNRLLSLTLILSAIALIPIQFGVGQDLTADAIQRATRNISSQQKYDLRHKCKVGDHYHWTTEHSESTRTQIAGETVNQSSRALAEISWEVTEIDSKGHMTFVFQIDSVNMWQQKDENEPITFNSKTDKKAPIDYEVFQQCVGTPVSKMVMTPKGQVLNRQDYVKQARIGMGKMTILPLPKNPVSVGHQWYLSGSLSAKDEHGVMKHLETRVHYTLSGVKDGKAYIQFQTEVLTPFDSQKIQSQIMQNMAKGFAVFDIEQGRVVRREVDWNETVQGFQGPGSYLKYNANYRERFVPKTKKVEVAELEIKPIDGKPMLRR